MTVLTDTRQAGEPRNDAVVLSPVPYPIRQLLRRERIRRGLTPEDMARLSGIQAGEVDALESGHPVSTAGTVQLLVDLDRLAAAVGIADGRVVEETLTSWARVFSQFGGDLPTEDRTPAFSREPSVDSQPRSETTAGLPSRHRAGTVERCLRRAVVLVTVLLVASSVALGLVRAQKSAIHLASHPKSAPTASTAAAPPITETASGPGGATYLSSSSTLSLTFIVSRPSWVQVTAPSGPPQLGSVLPPGTTGPLTVTVPFTVQIGAGGTALVVTGLHGNARLTPPSAPFTYTISSQPMA
jgi:transcriptional regulator with XRE-family HTH domain